jgi:hypothetical protein
VIVVLLNFLHEGVIYFFKGNIINFTSASLLLMLYGWFIIQVERKEFQRLPGVGKYFKSHLFQKV